MKKMFVLILWVFVLFFFTWCGEKYTYTIRFDDKSFDFLSVEEYQQVVVSSLNNNYLASNLIVVYNPKNNLEENVFENNLLISSSAINADIDLTVFVDDNLQKLEQMFVWYDLEDTDNVSFICGNTTIDAVMKTFRIVELDDIEKDLYFGEYFFIHRGYGFVVSFVSEERSERNLFESSMSSLRCD